MIRPEYKDPSLRLNGDGFYLRSLAETDATPRYISWLNDHETTRYLETRPGDATLKSLVGYVKHHAERVDSLLMGIFMEDGDLHIGNVKLEPIVIVHRRAVIGIMIGEKRARGHGFGTKAIKLILKYAFGEMGLNRIELGVTADNEPAIACYERMGFVREGIARQATRRADGFVDNYTYGMLKSEYRARHE